MWLEVDAGFRHESFREFTVVAEDHDLRVMPIPIDRSTPLEAALESASAFVLRTTAYIEQEPLGDQFLRALDTGKRCLVLVPPRGRSIRDGKITLHDDVNPWFEERFGIATVDDQHFDLSRWRDPEWQDRRDKDELVARPASPREKLDTLLSGVERVIVERPFIVRCLEQSQPLLAVQNKDVVTHVDLPLPEDHITDDDECVAATWSRPGSGTPQLVVLGAPGCISDPFLQPPRADNRRFAENIVRWLGGERFALELASEAKTLIDEVELTLGEIVRSRLAAKYGGAWWNGIPRSRLEKILTRRPDVPLEQALDLSDQIGLIQRDYDLAAELYQFGGRSRNKSASHWARVVQLRNRAAHPVRLVDPITECDLDLLRETVEHVRRRRREWRASLDDDPAL
jgi:hypothetical protein